MWSGKHYVKAFCKGHNLENQSKTRSSEYYSNIPEEKTELLSDEKQMKWPIEVDGRCYTSDEVMQLLKKHKQEEDKKFHTCYRCSKRYIDNERVGMIEHELDQIPSNCSSWGYASKPYVTGFTINSTCGNGKEIKLCDDCILELEQWLSKKQNNESPTYSQVISEYLSLSHGYPCPSGTKCLLINPSTHEYKITEFEPDTITTDWVVVFSEPTDVTNDTSRYDLNNILVRMGWGPLPLARLIRRNK